MVAPSIAQLVLIIQHAGSKSTNPYRPVMYIISPCYEQSMSSIGANYLRMFLRESFNQNCLFFREILSFQPAMAF